VATVLSVLLGDKHRSRGGWERVVPGDRVISARRYVQRQMCRGTRRLAVCVSRQAVWKRLHPAVRVPCQAILLLQPRVVGFCMRDLQGFWWYFKGGIVGFLDLSSEHIPWVELEIGVKHVAFLELSSRWRMNTRNPWVELGLASVAGVSVLVVASTDGSRWIAHLSDELTSLVVLGCYEQCSYLGTPPSVMVYDP